MELIIANGIMAVSHAYLMAQFITLFTKSKYSQNKTALFYFLSIYSVSMGMNYLLPQVASVKIIFGILSMAIVMFFVSEESFCVRMGKALACYFAIIILDPFTMIVVFPFYFEKISFFLTVNPTLIMTRILYAMVLYLAVVLAEMICYRKKTPEYMPVFLVFFALGIVEMGILKCVVLLDPLGIRSHFATLSGVSGISIILQYYLGLEILRSHIAKKEQEALMEEMQKEQDYHYESYQLANKQNEKLRDIRHDMNNYLQTILVLGEDEMTKEQANTMLTDLKGKVTQAFEEQIV
ncbi:MAG: hypothetical protein MJ087_03250 [Lachnospiraceae bacterium]|nr:hypothetical protein [Lachnospiraceae bacterium]